MTAGEVDVTEQNSETLLSNKWQTMNGKTMQKIIKYTSAFDRYCLRHIVQSARVFHDFVFVCRLLASTVS